MKGRTICPKCKHEFILELKEDGKEHSVVCPNCKKDFSIKAECKDTDSNLECSWEEHGEPRKTILSKIKPKSNKPTVAAIILICVFVIGLNTALFSDLFIESSLDIASGVGLTGTARIIVTDLENKTIEEADIKIDSISGKTDVNGVFFIKELDLGLKILEIYYDNISYKREVLITPFINYEDTIKLNLGKVSEELIKFNGSGCTLILLIFSIFAILGTIACIKRQHFDVAVVTSFMGIFSFGFFFIGSILSIIAFIIILKSKDEFEDGKKGKMF